MAKTITRKLEEYKDIPYAIVANTHLEPSFFIYLKGNAVKSIAKQLKKDEDLRIEIKQHDNGFSSHEFLVIGKELSKV